MYNEKYIKKLWKKNGTFVIYLANEINIYVNMNVHHCT